MARYAEKTMVSVEKSRTEIERNLMRYGATAFQYGINQGQGIAIIQFAIANRIIKKKIPLPVMDDFNKTPKGRRHRNSDGQERAWEQACRQRWRAVNLGILAKLEAVEAGISTIEEEFLAEIMLPNQQTLYEHTAGMIKNAYETGKVPKLLPGF